MARKKFNRDNGQIPTQVRQFLRTADAHAMNEDTFLDYFYKLENIAISMFEWGNIPATVDERFLEKTLIERGVAVWFEDEIIGHLALNVTWSGPLNVYNIPIKRKAYATNGYNRYLTAEDSVLIYNNFMHTPLLNMIILYSQRLAEIERAIDVNVKAQKTPIAISAEESQVLTMKTLYRQYDGNEPVIFGTKGIDLKEIQVINPEAPFVADRLNFLKRQYWNEAIGFFGVENTGFEKKEQVQRQEILSSLGGVMASRYVMLNARRQAAEQINKKFGLDLKVNFRQPLSIFNPNMDVTTMETPYTINDAATTELTGDPRIKEDIL